LSEQASSFVFSLSRKLVIDLPAPDGNAGEMRRELHLGSVSN
jgi:hypothetical protein